MLVIIEGIDGSGKSELTNYFVKKHKFTYFNKDMRGHKFSNIKTFKKCLEVGKLNNIVLDRFIYSEWVYSQSLRNKKFDLFGLEVDIGIDKISNIVLIVLDIDPVIAYQRIKLRDKQEEKQNLSKDRLLFIDAINLSIIENKIIIFNNNFEFVKKIADGIVK